MKGETGIKHKGQETKASELQPSPLALRRVNLLDFREMHDGRFCMFGRLVGVTGLAM